MESLASENSSHTIKQELINIQIYEMYTFF